MQNNRWCDSSLVFAINGTLLFTFFWNVITRMDSSNVCHSGEFENCRGTDKIQQVVDFFVLNETTIGQEKIRRKYSINEKNYKLENSTTISIIMSSDCEMNRLNWRHSLALQSAVKPPSSDWKWCVNANYIILLNIGHTLSLIAALLRKIHTIFKHNFFSVQNKFQCIETN